MYIRLYSSIKPVCPQLQHWTLVIMKAIKWISLIQLGIAIVYDFLYIKFPVSLVPPSGFVLFDGKTRFLTFWAVVRENIYIL